MVRKEFTMINLSV